MAGGVGILNVGAGDTKLTFDKSNPAECIRAARIVKDMLRRGYALLVKKEDGTHVRALDFDENTCEYIIADFDPGVRHEEETARGAELEPQAHSAASEPGAGNEASAGHGKIARGRRSTKRVPADSTNAVAVSRTAGG